MMDILKSKFRKLSVSISLVKKVLRLYKKWGTVINPWRKIPGRHKTFDRNDMNVSIEQCNYNFIKY